MKLKLLLVTILLSASQIVTSQHLIDFHIPPCPWVHTPTINVDNDVKLYPNPTNGNLYVETGLFSIDAQSEVEIFNVYGQKIFSELIYQQEEKLLIIDVSKFSKAVYILRLKTAEKSIEKQFVIY